MKTSFKDIYLPIKAGITGNLILHEEKVFSDLVKSVKVTYHPDKPIGKWVISAGFLYKSQSIRLCYGKTQKEIKTLIQDIKDFNSDPHLVLNQ